MTEVQCSENLLKVFKKEYNITRASSQDTLSEWLRRWTRNPLGSARKGSNPLGVVFVDFRTARVK